MIELRFDGPREEELLHIADAKLTIRAGEGFTPVIRFAPAPVEATTSPQSMITVSGGSVSLMNVAIEFIVPRGVASDHWTLVEIQRPELLRLERTTLTIQNSPEGKTSSRPQVEFFAVAENLATENEKDVDATDSSAQVPVDIELQNCIVRGEATFIWVAGGASARVLWNNGLLATTGRLLIADGSPRLDMRSRVFLDLRHLTADVRSGLAWLDFRSMGVGGLLADLRIADSIIHVGSDAPLVEQADPLSSTDFEGTLSWSGDRNFYEAVDVFWLRTSATAPDSGQHLTFADWQSFWGQSRENFPNMNAVVWQQPFDMEQPLHMRTPADYALSTSTAHNPARDSASDGFDAGCLLKQLPALPSP